MTCILAMHDPVGNFVHMMADKGIHSMGVLHEGPEVQKIKRPRAGMFVGFAGWAYSSAYLVHVPEYEQCDLADDASIARLAAYVHGNEVEMLMVERGHIVVVTGRGWTRVGSVGAVGLVDEGLRAFELLSTLAPRDRLEIAIQLVAVARPTFVSRYVDYVCTGT